MVSRNQIADALMELLINSYTFGFTSRKLKMLEAVSVNLRPALFLTNYDQSVSYQSETLRKRSMTFRAVIYTSARDPDISGDVLLNDILDAIETALAPSGADILINRQTLGGIVSHCYIEGEITKDPGDLDKDGLAVIPIIVLMP